MFCKGEEFPGDDLGARAFVSSLLDRKQDIQGLVLLDMIGHRENSSDPVFQVNPGNSQQSLLLADLVLDSYLMLNFSNIFLSPRLRKWLDPYSYLYNTDGLIFSSVGYPVVLINEHINYYENFGRVGYHDTKDTSALIDFDYAVALSKIAIQTVALVAGIHN